MDVWMEGALRGKVYPLKEPWGRKVCVSPNSRIESLQASTSGSPPYTCEYGRPTLCAMTKFQE